MADTIIGKIVWAIFLGLLLFGIITAFTKIDNEAFAKQLVENPKETSLGFFMFSQGLGSSTPAWSLFDGKIQIPYPDSTDIIGLFIFSILAIIVINMSARLKGNIVLATLVFFLILIGGWFIWKIFMYYVYLWGAEMMGLSLEQAKEVRNAVLATGEKLGYPLLFLTLFIFIAALKALPWPWRSG